MSPQRLTPAELDHLLATPSPFQSSPTTSDPSLLRLLASVDRDALAQLITDHQYQPGEIIFEEGESGDSMYLIRAGRVAVIKGGFDSPTILGLRGPGEIIGEMSLLEDQPRSATNVALDSVRLLRITRDGFQRLVSARPDIGISIMRMLSGRLRDADNVRTSALQGGQQLVKQVSRLESEKEQLLELQRVRKETSDLIVHDLRNPLGIIYGVLNMFEMVLPVEVLHDNRELFDLATTGCERMQRLVDSLLDVAKLETGEMVLNLTSTNLRPLIEEAAHREALASKLRGVVIETAADDNLPPAIMDAEQIDRVLANLIDNALKYSPEQSHLFVDAHAEPGQIVVSVTDQGPGIPAQERERIFERFAQIAGDKPSRRGFGLGLTFCRLTIEAHGGRIWVEAGPGGVGSRFIFTLPLS
jgi:signal transduction histidine kinase